MSYTLSSAVHLPRLTPDGASGKRLLKALLLAAAVHGVLVLLLKGQFPEFEPRKLPDLVIELGRAPQSGPVGGDQPIAPASKATQTPVAPPEASKPKAVPLPVPAVNPKAERATPSPAPVATPDPDSAKVKAAPVPPPPLLSPSQPSTPPKAGPVPNQQAAPSAVTSAQPQAKPSPQVVAPASAGNNIPQGNPNAQSDSVRTVEADYKAAYLNNPRPPYPRTAHRLGIEGTVVLVAEVSEDGKPLQVRVFQSSGNELLDESALSTVSQWKFSPARKDGNIIRSVVKIPITFSLRAKR